MAQRYLPGRLIRNKKTGQALFVVHVYRFCTIVSDPTEANIPQLRILYERDYADWVPDEEFSCKENNDPMDPQPIITHNPITL